MITNLFRTAQKKIKLNNFILRDHYNWIYRCRKANHCERTDATKDERTKTDRIAEHDNKILYLTITSLVLLAKLPPPPA